MADTPPGYGLSELYPQCVALRKELDALLLAISSPPTPQALATSAAGCAGASAGGVYGRPSGSSSREDRNGACTSVAKLQRFSALTRQFCMSVLRLQEALASAKSNQMSRSVHSMWDRRVQDLLADAESFRREAEGRMNLEQQRVEDAMRERKALLGEASGSKRWGDLRNTELMYARERDKLQESSKMLDSVLAQGWSIVGQLVSQNSSLKSARRKVLDMASSAGVASTLLGAVVRRQQGDKWLVYGGMIVTLIFFFMVYRLFHYGSIFSLATSPTDAAEESGFSEVDMSW
ncbi:Golgi snare related protein [Cyclospora cayetanensis]|uniref:Golgi snare related protein n=1 Tax=Cyclospora cayetanensis TaxID=88456 RepID=A0A1D3D2U0_9EIME|nr:Golgi snare related protein [Cyclospora cayetanensis]